MLTGIIGLMGVVLGILLNEYFRRRNRIETYSKEVFQKRLAIYEELYKKMEDAYLIANDVIENPDYSKEERYTIWSNVGMNVANFTDQNGLYLNDNLTVHCMMTLIGIEDIYHMTDLEQKNTEIAKFREAYRAAKNMIRKEAGIEALDKLFGSISKANHKSDFIDYYRKRKKELGK